MATQFFLATDGGDGVIDGPVTWRGSWDNTASARERMFDPVQIRGGPSSRTVAETSALNPYRVAIYRFTSRPIQAQTISGTLDWIIGCVESNIAADFYWKVYAYIRVGKTDAVRHVLLDYEDSTEEWPLTSTGTAAPAAMPALTAGAAQDGDTIVIELGYISRNASTTSRSGTIRVGCMTASESFTPQALLTVGSTNTSTEAGTITFSQTINFVPIANDLYANRTVLTGTLAESLDLTSATWDGDEPTPCSGSALNTHARYSSVWYEWTCPVNQNATVTADIVNGASTFDTVLMVLTGTPGSFVTVDCKSENDPSFESITFAATAGTVYTILVMTVYYGGGQLSFTFTPSVAPSSDEVAIKTNYSGNLDFTEYTAMGWVKIVAVDAALHHFHAISEGVTLGVPGDSYAFVGTDVDGLTLRLDLYNGTVLTTVLGSMLALDTWYHWVYQHDHDVHTVYLAVEGGSHAIDIGPTTKALGMAAPQNGFVYALENIFIPKSFKVWEAVLNPSTMDTEADRYNVSAKTGIWNVSQFRTDTVDTTGGWTDYSGYDQRLGRVVIGGGTEWEIIRGPQLSTLPARPFSDDFESYTPGAPVGPYFPGVVDQAQNYEYLTQPTFSAFIHAGVGVSGSQAFDSEQASALIWFEYDGYDDLCGQVACDSYKATAHYGGLAHGVGITIGYQPDANAGALSFGFLNTLGTADLRFFNLWDGTDVSVPNVYLDDVYQHIELNFQLSTVAPSQVDVNPDGVVEIFIDGVLVYSKYDLKLTVNDQQWTSDLNTWNTVSFAWGGYLDNVSVGITCPPNCPGIADNQRQDGLPYTPAFVS